MAPAVTVKQFLKLWVASITSALAKKNRLSLSDQDFERGIKKQETDELRREYIKEKDSRTTFFKKCGSVSGTSVLKQILQSRLRLRLTLPIEDFFLLIV